MNKLIIGLGVLCLPNLAFAVCPVNAKQCSFEFINKTEMALVPEIESSLDARVNPATIPAESSTTVTLSDLFGKDVGTISSLKISSVSEGLTEGGNDKTISDTVRFDIAERKAMMPSYKLPQGETETVGGKKYGSFYHAAKTGVGSLNDYDKIEIERASSWARGKFFNIYGIKTVNGVERRVELY